MTTNETLLTHIEIGGKSVPVYINPAGEFSAIIHDERITAESLADLRERLELVHRFAPKGSRP